MKKTGACAVLAAALLITQTGAFAAATPKVDANGTATEESTETEAGGDEAAELAKQLQNPVASLISVPFQNNFEFNLGPNDDGFKHTLNFQRVIPVSLSKDWNLIVRTIVQDARQSWLGSEILCREPCGRAGLGSALHRHPVVSHWHQVIQAEARTHDRDVR